MAITDQDEWLRPGAAHDEVTLAVDDDIAAVAVRAVLVVTPTHRRASVVVDAFGASGRHDANEPGGPLTNWDRMRIGAVEWRMVEPLLRWDLSADDPVAGLRAYLSFLGTGPCTPLPDGYAQVGTVSGQVQLADQVVTLADSAARRTHTWR